MTMIVTTAMLLNWLRRTADCVHTQCELLTALDAAIGDADHGINLDRGFQSVVHSLPTLADHDAGHILKATGMRLISTVGGASGPLYGTAFRRAGMTLEQRQTVTAEELLPAFRAFVQGIKTMGQAEQGQKTMLDALIPALATLEAELTAGTDLPAALEQATLAANAGAEATIPLVAQRGRASYLGERSAGHKDPGATSAALIVYTLAETIAEAA
jgi:phosphoenolpyruvate---glycerone phosphotransferase subunit DhaL